MLAVATDMLGSDSVPSSNSIDDDEAAMDEGSGLCGGKVSMTMKPERELREDGREEYRSPSARRLGCID
jgi:hypothetical protein